MMYNSTMKRQTTHLKNGQKIQIIIFSNKIYNWCMKRCSTLLVTRAMQTKILVKYLITPTRIGNRKRKIVCVSKDMGKLEPTCIAERNVK